ncbi:MAG: hypothetical protein JWN17_275 [Frankiales bacterium]|nr:hypothetical protein [Frankiales bacterium]
MERRPDPPSWETDDVPVVLAGTGLWLVALVVLGVLRLTGTGDVQDWWLAMCGCGIVLGLVGVRHCRRRQAHLGRADTAEQPTAPTAPAAD